MFIIKHKRRFVNRDFDIYYNNFVNLSDSVENLKEVVPKTAEILRIIKSSLKYLKAPLKAVPLKLILLFTFLLIPQ